MFSSANQTQWHLATGLFCISAVHHLTPGGSIAIRLGQICIRFARGFPAHWVWRRGFEPWGVHRGGGGP